MGAQPAEAADTITGAEVHMVSKLESALDLAAKGFSVFPLVPNAKNPAIKNWQNLATSDKKQVQKWWSNGSDYNIGVLTENLLVVDVDPRSGGFESFAELKLADDVPNTAISITRSGGMHLVYRLPERTTVKGGVHKFGQGVDVKARGGYIVAPGSTVGGGTYRWKGQTPPQPAPQWMIDRCGAPSPKSKHAGERVVEEDDIAIELAGNYVEYQAPHVSMGAIDDTSFVVAARLYDFGVEPDTAIDLLAWWSDTHCNPPMEMDRMRVVCDSASRNRSRAIGCSHPNAPGFEPVEIKPRAAAAPATPRPKLYHLPYAEAAELALTDASESLIEGLLDRLAMSVWYGESNSGKTFAMLDASWHIAAGRPWAGMPVRRGAVVYVAAEGGKGILKRVRALRDRYPEAGNVPLHLIPCPVDLLHQNTDLKPLVALIREIEAQTGIKVELVVIDTLSRAIAGGNENDSQDMGIFVGHLDALRTATGAHVAVVHHTGKDKARGARGHSLLRAATDTEIEIDARTLTVTKQRDMDGDIKIPFALKPVRIGMSKTGREITSCVVEMRQNGVAAVPTTLTPDAEAFADEIQESLDALYDKNPERVYSQPFSTAFAIECYASLSAENGRDHLADSNAFRQRVKRALVVLVENGHIKKGQRSQWFLVNGRNGQ